MAYDVRSDLPREDADLIRIDDLAQRTGIASGTIRFYQREGLIPPPRREGRVAYYSPAHAERLERVKTLQARGLPLALVRDLLEREDAGEDVSGWLALDTAVFDERGTPSEPVELLERRLLDAGVDEDVIRRGAELVEERVRGVADALAELGWDVFADERARIEAGEPVAADVLRKLEEMRGLAQRVVATLFPRALDDAVRRRTEAYAAEVVARRAAR